MTDHQHVREEPTMSAPKPTNRTGNAWLCFAHGETDRPVAEVVHSRAEVRAFFVREWIGEEESEELDEAMGEFDGHDWSDGPLEWRFEIGGVEVTDVYDNRQCEQTDAPQCAASGDDDREASGVVYVCPFADRECGDRPASWCDHCPKRSLAARGQCAAAAPAGMVVPAGCSYSSLSSRTCHRGTVGCEIRHSIRRPQATGESKP